MDTPKIGQLFLEKLWKQWPELSPSHVNSFEPIKHVVSSSAEAIEHWGSTFLWKNRRKRIQGSVWPGAEGESSWVVIKVQNCKDTQVFLSSFKQIAEFLKVDVATFHSIIKEEPAIFGSAKYALQCGFPPVALKRGIPDIPWQILFSATYADKLSLNGSPPSPASSRSLGLLTEVLTRRLNSQRFLSNVL